MGKLADKAKQLGVSEDALTALYHDLVQLDTGVDYATLAERLNSDTATEPEQQVSAEEAQVAALTSKLAQQWNVTPDVVNTRLEQMNAVFEKMPEATRAQYSSLEGIQNLWNVVSAVQPQEPQQVPQQVPQQQQTFAQDGEVRKSTEPVKGISPANLLSGLANRTSYSFDQLVDMPEAEYAALANSGKLLAAFNNGQVADTALALRPVVEQQSIMSGNIAR